MSTDRPEPEPSDPYQPRLNYVGPSINEELRNEIYALVRKKTERILARHWN